jgi:hypothetical protein
MLFFTHTISTSILSMLSSFLGVCNGSLFASTTSLTSSSYFLDMFPFDYLLRKYRCSPIFYVTCSICFTRTLWPIFFMLTISISSYILSDSLIFIALTLLLRSRSIYPGTYWMSPLHLYHWHFHSQIIKW